MKRPLLPLTAALALGFAIPAALGQDPAKDPAPAGEKPAPAKPAEPPLDEAGKKARDEAAKKQEAEQNKSEEALKKEAESFTRRLKGETAGKLWEVVHKGDDEALKATGLPAETIETIKAERGNLKGLYSILGNEKLGKDVLKQLVAYGSSSKFAKSIEEEAKAKEKAEKERVRDKKRAKRDRDKEEKEDKDE